MSSPTCPDKTKSLTRGLILTFVQANPGLTSTQITRILCLKPGTVSSTLLRLIDKGQLVRTAGLGPRGGWVYFAK